MSWDRTNCTAGWARDTLFPHDAATQQPECTVNIAFFTTFLALLFVLQVVMFIVKLRLSLRQARRRKMRGLLPQQNVTLLLAVLAPVAVFLMMLLPNTPTPPGSPDMNVMYFLFGMLLTMAQITLFRWVWKLRRLGYRLILKRLPNLRDAIHKSGGGVDSSPSSPSTPSPPPPPQQQQQQQDTSLNRLTDRSTIVLTLLGYLVTFLFFTCTCVLGSMVFQHNAIFPQAAFALFALFGALTLVSALTQTEQCIRVIVNTSKNVADGVIESSMQDRYAAVVLKFRTQQRIIYGMGVPCVVMCVLVATRVIPIGHEVFLSFVCIDVMGALAMLGSMTVKCGGGSGGGGQRSNSEGDEDDGGGVGVGQADKHSKSSTLRSPMNSKDQQHALSSFVSGEAAAAVVVQQPPNA